MRISSISSANVYHNQINKTNRVKNDFNTSKTEVINNQAPNFKGCNFYKIAGFIIGTAAIVVAAPAVAAVGLAGIGAGTGALIGAAIDEKIDEKNGKTD